MHYCYCLESIETLSIVPNTFCNGNCSGNEYEKCGSDEEMYHSIYYVGSYFDVLSGQEGGNTIDYHKTDRMKIVDL